MALRFKLSIDFIFNLVHSEFSDRLSHALIKMWRNEILCNLAYIKSTMYMMYIDDLNTRVHYN